MVRQAVTPERSSGDANEEWPKRRLFNVEEYHRMGKAGILRHDERTELWEGEIVLMPPIGDGHAGSTGVFNNWLARRLLERAIIWMQNPVRLSPHYEPQPDILVLRPRADFYRSGLPDPDDVLLLVEVADTSLRYDRDRKLPRYAEFGIPEVWIADLKRKRLLAYRHPSEGTYTEQFVLGPADSVSPIAFHDVIIPIAAVLG